MFKITFSSHFAPEKDCIDGIEVSVAVSFQVIFPADVFAPAPELPVSLIIRSDGPVDRLRI